MTRYSTPSRGVFDQELYQFLKTTAVPRNEDDAVPITKLRRFLAEHDLLYTSVQLVRRLRLLGYSAARRRVDGVRTTVIWDERTH